jgi:hypothetical protein
LRLETASNSDKKKSELYFSFSVKKILTEKPKRASPQAVKISSLHNERSPLQPSAFSLLHHTVNVFLRL